jgi:hypothetical protein
MKNLIKQTINPPCFDTYADRDANKTRKILKKKMTTGLQDPADFGLELVFDGIEVRYDNVYEIGQGGPITGALYIDQTWVRNFRFGGPLLYSDGYLFLPVFVKRFIGTGFRLAKINIKTLDV